MNHFQMLKSMVFLILEELEAAEKIPLGINRDKISVELPRERSHGDLSTNVALVLAKPTGFKPRELASLICEQLLNKEHIVSAKIAGPGFINVCFSNNFWRECLKNIIRSGSEYGSSEIGSGRIINVEYVSANPTGPLHVGHGRGAVVGDVLASLLDKTGFEVTKEYYINDAGGQIEVLARSLFFRYQEIHGVENGAISDDYYSGNYLVKVAKALQKRDGAKWLGMEVKDWLLPFEEFAVQSMMSLIKEDLKLLGVQHDVFTSERDVVASGIIDQVLSTLEKKNLLLKDVLERPKSKGASNWRERSQVLFKSTIFGDDTNRPIKKSDGSWTYFASDMAYHMDKYHRNFDDMINIWGADHGGYITRMKAAVEALTEGDGVLDVKICQLVNLVKDGNSIKMSKRNDSFVTLREVIEEVGKDVFRFIMLTRKNDAPLDFDLSGVVQQSKDNPVFYVQYSNARCHSVLRRAESTLDGMALTLNSLVNAKYDLIQNEMELSLIKHLANWPKTIEDAAEAREPHRIVYFLIELSSLFHTLWTKGARGDESLRFISEKDIPLTLARLGLVTATKVVIESGLRIIGVEPIEEMH